MPQIWGKRLYFPFRPKNPTASAGSEPATLGTRGQHANHQTTDADYAGQDYSLCLRDTSVRTAQPHCLSDIHISATNTPDTALYLHEEAPWHCVLTGESEESTKKVDLLRAFILRTDGQPDVAKQTYECFAQLPLVSPAGNYVYHCETSPTPCMYVWGRGIVTKTGRFPVHPPSDIGNKDVMDFLAGEFRSVFQSKRRILTSLLTGMNCVNIMWDIYIYSAFFL
jgi:hypothetical protein